MNTSGAGRDSAKAGRRARSTDFLFVGAGVAPLALMLGGQPAIAFLILIPLLFAACLCGAWEQAVSDSGNATGDCGGPLGGKPPAAGSQPCASSLKRVDALRLAGRQPASLSWQP